jgi:uncharacterized membrane protein
MTHNDFTYAELLRFGWDKTKEHFWFLLGIFALAIVLEAAVGRIPVVSTAVSFVVGIATIAIALRIAEGHAPQYRDLLKPFETYKITWHYFAASILLFLAFLVPGALVATLLVVLHSLPATIIGVVVLVCAILYFAVRVQFFKYFIVEMSHVGPVEAYRKSFAITKNRFWKLFGFLVVAILLNILGAIALIVGLLFTIPTTLLAYTHLYKKLTAHPAHHEGHTEVA